MTVRQTSGNTRLLGAAIGIGVLVLAMLLFVAPARFMTVDDAKYLGIGTNVFAGLGPTTVFGIFFPFHSPLWPMIVVGPRVLFGVDPVWWAHLLTIVSACGVVALTAYLGWRIWPLAGVAAAATVIANPYFLNLGRGLGLDLPAAVLTLAYLVIGLMAVRRRSMPWALAAGLMFALAFLVKEIALPFAPAPFLAGLVRGVPTRTIARLAAAAMLVGAVGTSWWFVVFAQQTGTVYRLETPAWTLGPIALIIGVLGVAGLAADRYSGPSAGAGPGRWSGFGPVHLGWIGTVVWAVALTMFFALTRAGTTAGFLNPTEVRNYLVTWLPELGPILAIGLVGAVIATIERVRSARATGGRDDLGRTPRPAGGDASERIVDWSSVDDLIIASVCGLPLVLLVVSVGEIPRHYIAQLAILAALGSAGWLLLGRRLIRGKDRTTLAIFGVGCIAAGAILIPSILDQGSVRRAVAFLGLLVAVGAVFLVRILAQRPHDRRIDRLAPIGLAAALMVVASLVAATRVLRPPSAIDVAKADAVRAAGDWVRGHVPRGAAIGFGPVLGYETAITLQEEYRAITISAFQGLQIDPTAPLGVRRIGDPPADDWIAFTAAPRLLSSIYGYRSGPLEAQIRDLGIRVWIQNSLSGTDNPTTIDDSLRLASGVGSAAQWSWPFGSSDLDTTVFTIEPDRLRFGRPLVVGVTALERIVGVLEREPGHGSATAATLLERVVVQPDGAAAEAVLERLRKVAASGPAGPDGSEPPGGQAG